MEHHALVWKFRECRELWSFMAGYFLSTYRVRWEFSYLEYNQSNPEQLNLEIGIRSTLRTH